jgi:hypothetical protein
VLEEATLIKPPAVTPMFDPTQTAPRVVVVAGMAVLASTSSIAACTLVAARPEVVLL